MKPFLLLSALIAIAQQAATSEKCMCDFIASGEVFPDDQLKKVQDSAAGCNSIATPQKTFNLQSLLLALEHRLPQLQQDVNVLEKEDDGQLYGFLSLHIIENELTEIQQLIQKLNDTVAEDRLLSERAAQQLTGVKEQMEELEKFDTMQVVKRQQANQRLKRDLDQCRNGANPSAPHPQPTLESCPQGTFVNVTGPRVHTQGEYPGSYKYGAWGRDPKPEAGKESWHWLVLMTSNNKWANYVRLYSSLSSLIVGVSVPGNVQIHPSNPTTNTIQGPNVIMYAGALYYNCYNKDSVCRFNLTSKAVSRLDLPKGTRFNSKGNFCHLDECYPFTDLDLATDESGVWVTYTTTQNFGNLVLSKVEGGEEPTLGKTWRTSVYKQSVTNTFMICGVLYATRYVDPKLEEIFYSFDTITGKENFRVGIFINKMSANILFLNYSPADQMLHAYSDSYMVSYKTLFQPTDHSYP